LLFVLCPEARHLSVTGFLLSEALISLKKKTLWLGKKSIPSMHTHKWLLWEIQKLYLNKLWLFKQFTLTLILVHCFYFLNQQLLLNTDVKKYTIFNIPGTTEIQMEIDLIHSWPVQLLDWCWSIFLRPSGI
jgi:hypothetical protein